MPWKNERVGQKIAPPPNQSRVETHFVSVLLFRVPAPCGRCILGVCYVMTCYVTSSVTPDKISQLATCWENSSRGLSKTIFVAIICTAGGSRGLGPPSHQRQKMALFAPLLGRDNYSEVGGKVLGRAFGKKSDLKKPSQPILAESVRHIRSWLAHKR